MGERKGFHDPLPVRRSIHSAVAGSRLCPHQICGASRQELPSQKNIGVERRFIEIVAGDWNAADVECRRTDETAVILI